MIAEDEKQARPLWFGWAIFGGVLIVAVVALTLTWPALVSAMQNTSIWPRPTPYSEVFFTDQAAADTTVTFDLGNSESDTTTYQYKATVACEGDVTRQIAQGATTLEVEAHETISVPLTDQSCDTSPTLKIDVNYVQPDTNETRSLRLTRHLSAIGADNNQPSSP